MGSSERFARYGSDGSLVFSIIREIVSIIKKTSISFDRKTLETLTEIENLCFDIYNVSIGGRSGAIRLLSKLAGSRVIEYLKEIRKETNKWSSCHTNCLSL